MTIQNGVRLAKCIFKYEFGAAINGGSRIAVLSDRTGTIAEIRTAKFTNHCASYPIPIANV
jgi:hypothetical protein